MTLRAYSDQELRLLQLLRKQYPTVTAAHVEMVNLRAILALPKGTDHYISDIHGAYDQFDHMLRHASGAIRRKIAETFAAELSAPEQAALAMVVYYPERQLRSALQREEEPRAWMRLTIPRLVRVARTAAQKYTRSKVRKRLPARWRYTLDELMTESEHEEHPKADYIRGIVDSVVALGEGEAVITVLSDLIRSLVVDRLHILGDIYDRGPAAERVMDRLMAYHDVSIQWGNHDIIWMGAAAGADVLVANVVRLSLRYGNVETLLDGYSIDLRRLAHVADTLYGSAPAPAFDPPATMSLEGFSTEQVARMHKAIAVIQFKLEAGVIARHPEYEMEDRLLLERLDLEAGAITLDGVRYPLRDPHLPTLSSGELAALTEAEAGVMADLRYQFLHSERLQEHVRFLYSYSGMFQVENGNLKLHGCLPVDEAGEFIEFPLAGRRLAGPALLARYEELAREAYFATDSRARESGQDAIWYLWCGRHSPLFGRLRMTTFERYFIAEGATHTEPKGAYYRWRDSEAFCRKVLAAFGGDPERGRIINGHTPVKLKQGERPLRANGKLVVIDGGMSEPYQKVTGIAGYTLIANSYEQVLAAHPPFAAMEATLAQEQDVTPHTEPIGTFSPRMLIGMTDKGRELRGQLEDLERLVDAYRRGILVEDAARRERDG